MYYRSSTFPSTAAGFEGNVYAVIVAYRRYDRLAVALRSIDEQNTPVARIIVVDNTPAEERKRPETRTQLTWLITERNLGGAGGYVLGIAHALALGADHILLLDDDGALVGKEFIADALAELEATKADLIAPLPIDESHPDQLCFPYRKGIRRTYRVADVEPMGRIEGFAHLFNGCLAPAETFTRFGLPDIRLYLRGDEVDFLQRTLGTGGNVVTSTRLKVTHPSARAEAHPVAGRWLMAVDPIDDVKRELTFRNRGYVFSRHRPLILAADFVRYFAHYILHRGDWRGYVKWVRLTIRGMRSRLGPPTARDGKNNRVEK